MRILVTGSAGFLGKQVVNALQARNHVVCGFDIANGQNILDLSDVQRAFEEAKPEAVVHLAAVADLYIFAKNPEGSRRINVEGTRIILAEAIKHGARVLFAGTCCGYGNNNTTTPNNEDAPLAPTEPYAISKVESEKDIFKAGLPHMVMRLATFYGPGMRAALCPAVFIDRAHKRETLYIHGAGTQTRTFTYIDDIVSGIVTLVEGEPRYQVVNVSTTESVSVLRVAQLAKEVTGNDVPVCHVEDRAGQIFHEEIDNTRLRSFGWEPRTSFAEGMAKSYADYCASLAPPASPCPCSDNDAKGEASA